MTAEILIQLLSMAQNLGLKALEKRSQKPIEEWTDADALKWLKDYEDGIVSTDDILGPSPEAGE